jgi:hypothetical protein
MNYKGAVLCLSALCCTFFLYAADTASVATGQSPDTCSKTKIKLTTLTSLFDKPEKGLMPSRFADANLTCFIDSTFIDSSNSIWYGIRIDKKMYWSQSVNFRMVTDATSDSTIEKSRSKQSDADSRRRMKVVMQNSSWPRRIQKAVKDGTICLGMTTEQLQGSWGEPIQRDSSFISDNVKFTLWTFKSSNGHLLTVNIINGKVCGWSL